VPGLVSPVVDEREGLLGFLNQQRYVLRLTAYGLNDEEARATPTASPLSIGGLIKHLASVERYWAGIIVQRGAAADNQNDYLSRFQLTDDQTVAGVLADYEEACNETDSVVGSFNDLADAVPIPSGVPWFPSDVDAWSVRWVILHLITETARHAGHADIIRESLDGGTAFPIMAAAEGWPVTSWMEPWKLA
jgi:uncharacterized damage-inducible protein DinB